MQEPDTPEAAARRSRLHGVRLQALVGEHLGRPVSVDAEPFPDGAAVVVDGEAWVTIEGSAARLLGRALAWAVRNDARRLHVVAGADTGLLARRASWFTFPIEVWYAEGRTLLPAPPEPLAPPPSPLEEHLALRPLIAGAGATPLVEHGVVFGEVRGLEVCRVVDRPTVGHLTETPVRPPERGVVLEVGVGANDREAFQIIHGEVPTVESLRGVVATVGRHRSDGAAQHPLNRLMIERYLRWRVEQDPATIGWRALRPAEPPVPRADLRDPTPCVARGVDGAGRDATAVFTAGVDLDLVPFLADVGEMGAERLEVVARGRDLVPISRELIALLRVPVGVTALP